jgi:hypothetical protein
MPMPFGTPVEAQLIDADGNLAMPAASDFTVTSGSTLGNSLPLNGVNAFFVSVEADSGQTLSGAGTLRCLMLDEKTKTVFRNPALDLSVTASGVRGMCFPDQKVEVPSGRSVLYYPDTVTLSAGGLTIRLRGWKTGA